jgi:tripartite motif-containing protein 2/3/tripartite motif-containing protein 71
MKKAVVKQIKEMTDNFKSDMLPPCEPANVKSKFSPELSKACQQFGRVLLQQISPVKCYATGKGLEVAKPGERATAVLHIVDQKGKACSTPVETLTCELVPKSTGEKIDCSVKKIEASDQYEISYQATSQGSRHQLHIKVEGEHIKGSPFPVTIIKKLGAPIKTITGLKRPLGVAVNQRGEIIVAEGRGHCVSIFSSTGEKLQSFGSKGSGNGQFNQPCGVAVDDDGNILVADANNHRVQKFTSAGKFIKAVGKVGIKPLEFYNPFGIVFHQKVYISDVANQRIQILNPDLTFSSSFGSQGIGNGQFSHPRGVACDSTGNVYVADSGNHCIQVFTAEGQFLRKFGKYGSGNGELDYPSGISIDSDDVVYVTETNNHRVSVFTCEGEFLTLFGKWGSKPGQFTFPRGIVVDKNGVVYVSDQNNNRLQLF